MVSTFLKGQNPPKSFVKTFTNFLFQTKSFTSLNDSKKMLFLLFGLLVVAFTTFPVNTTAFGSRSISTGQGQLHRYAYLRNGKPCMFEGKMYLSGQSIPRSNPCHACLCARGYVQCFWQRCPPPPEGCTEMTIANICNPSMYVCPIPERNLTQSINKVSHRRPKYGQRKLGRGLVKADCVIKGIGYFTGEVVGLATNNCMQCRCARHSLYCTPLCCFEHASSKEEEAERRYRSQGGYRAVAPHPLAHISEELGLVPSGII